MLFCCTLAYFCRHIYVEMQQLRSFAKKLDRFMVFAFVFMWHCPGTRLTMTFWVFISFFILYIEVICRNLTKTQLYSKLSRFIGVNIMSRLNKFLGGQLMLLSTINGMLFLCGKRTAILLFNEAYFNSFITYVTLAIIMYSFYHVGDFIHKFEISPKKAKKL